MKKETILMLKYATLPLLASIYPSLLHYANNASILVVSSLVRMALFNFLIALILYVLALVVFKCKSVEIANRVFIFLIFFNTYGLAHKYFFRLDRFQVEHYTLLPLYVLVGLYISWLVAKILSNSNQKVWDGTVLILSALILFNLVKIIPAEFNKNKAIPVGSTLSEVTSVEGSAVKEQYPDIYYIIFDEFAGFESMRHYWNYNGVNDFVNFLESKGFFIAEQSHSGTIDTLQIMTSRLNYQEYPLGAEYLDTYYSDIANNKVMAYLKTMGYTTVVFDETRASFAYPAKPPINADYKLEYMTDSYADLGVLFDDYGVLVADNTMLFAFSKYYKINNPVYQQHRGMIYYTINNISTRNIKSPKFVYVHLMLPHMPFMFDEDGNMIDQQQYLNWDYYLGNYKYTISVAEKLVTNIMSQSEPGNTPVIILQSDHGARNKLAGDPNGEALQNFPEEFKTNIMFALFLPGYDMSTIPQDVNPINTFPIVFNHLFDADIPLE
jgi:hypothetical protein